VNTGSYSPYLNQVGDPSRKIYMFDAARWTNTSGMAPDYNLAWDNNGSSPGGQFADPGPWDGFTRSFLPGTSMIYSMRHGDRTAAAAKGVPNSGKLRFNAAFFDGHVEALDGHTAMNPALYCPKGSVIPKSEVATGEAYNSFMSPASQIIAP